MEEARRLFPEFSYAGNVYEAATGADALVLMTEWNQYRALDLERIKSLMRTPLFIDLRNVYSPARMRAAGFTFVGVGRGEPL
jgi:UDPglucose 6-dehydrogenase